MAEAVRAVRPNAVMAIVKVLALVMLTCTSSVLGKEIKALGFYPPFQSFNVRGIVVLQAPFAA